MQVCTAVMKVGYEMVKRMKDEMLSFMEKHGFNTIGDFKGHSLQYFTTHADLNARQAQAKQEKLDKKGKAGATASRDDNWKGDIAKETKALVTD